jgi:hypothetical protein
MLKMFHLDVSKVVLGVAHVTMATPACFKSIFQVLNQFQTYVANFHLDFLKIDLVFAYVAMVPVASGQWLAAGFRLLPRAMRLGLSFPLPSLPFLSLHLAVAVRA